MSKNNYDPQKAHAYYERHKKLKGRDAHPNYTPPKVGQGSRVVDDNPNSSRHASGKKRQAVAAATDVARQRVGRLQGAVKKLEGALTEARAALSAKRATAKKTAKENSDGKSTEAEKTASSKYRDKHKAEIATKRKASSPSSSGSSSSSSSTSSVSTMSVTELETRVIKIQSALTDAKRQLSAAQQQLGQIAHSAITSEPEFQEQFARYLSAERRPSA